LHFTKPKPGTTGKLNKVCTKWSRQNFLFSYVWFPKSQLNAITNRKWQGLNQCLNSFHCYHWNNVLIFVRIQLCVTTLIPFHNFMVFYNMLTVCRLQVCMSLVLNVSFVPCMLLLKTSKCLKLVTGDVVKKNVITLYAYIKQTQLQWHYSGCCLLGGNSSKQTPKLCHSILVNLLMLSAPSVQIFFLWKRTCQPKKKLDNMKCSLCYTKWARAAK